MSADGGTPAVPLRALVEALLEGGVRDVVICPGSRSTPLALALRAAPDLACWVHLDERAGAFFAIGAARAARRPAAILATSGTAVVNFAPAVVEARYGRVPLIVLTADRPSELHHIGAPQTIDQRELYGRHAKMSIALPVLVATDAAVSHVRVEVGRALDVATTSPAGPVQINLPFREPLLPDGPLAIQSASASGHVAPVKRAPVIAADALDPAMRQLTAAARGLLVCGPLDEPGFAAAATSLAAASGFPLLADGLSSLRSGPHDRTHVVTHHDIILRSDGFRDAHTPDLVIRFGARSTSKILDQWLDVLDVPQLLVDDGGGWNRPQGPTLVAAHPVAFAVAVRAALDVERPPSTAWLAGWQTTDAAAADALMRWRTTLSESFEGSVAWALDESLPDGALVLVGNSMPIRDLDTFAPSSDRAIGYLGNRGANGIDGLLSTATGLAARHPGPVVVVLGDISLLHDLTALAAARRLAIDLTVLLVDNDGGGIFSFLPQSDAVRPELGLPEHYEELFGTPHGLDLGPVVESLGARHHAVTSQSLPSVLRAVVGQAGVHVLHLRTVRSRNVELHRAAHAAVADALVSMA